MAAGFQVSPLGDAAFGATVSGLMLAQLGDAEVRRALNALWVDRGVLLFRDGEDSPAMQVELSNCFGPLERHVYPETWAEGHPELVKIKYYPEDGTCYEVHGERLGGWLGWHSDLVYTDTINRGGILRPIQLPTRGGRTGFIDQIPAYERLPEQLKARIEGLHVVYEMDLNMANHKFGAPEDLRFVRGAQSFLKIMRRQYQYPRTLHPMVYVQQETGRKVLNVSPSFAVGIYELGGPDGDALLAEVIACCTAPANAYFHDWRYGDMVLWDNWRTLHCATGVPADETRVMHRTTIAGDYALGRKLEGGEGLPKIDV
ncbi:TauD/TfdA family dioxygenase [Phenylobacterium sp. LjRoot219]|uniref:TauD/TfdA dioxygenase family protein n=1 Tax=Phenylobacterium sp. LjRoot219 TaxID=3342283 RepID=UPI003ECF7D01